MAADAASIGSSFSGYTGDKILGGFTSPVFNIDTKSLMQLAAYAFDYGEKKWKQDQLDMEKAATELAEITEYNLQSDIPELSKEIRAKQKNLWEWAAANSSAANYKDNPDGWMELKKRKGEFVNDQLFVAAQDIIYKARKTEIEKAPSAALKTYYETNLEKDVKAVVDFRTPLKHSEKWDGGEVEFKAIPQLTFDVAGIGGNNNEVFTHTKRDMAAIVLQASAINSGLMGDVLNKNTDEFKKLTEKEKQYKIGEAEFKRASGRLALINQADIYTKVISGAKNTEGEIDVSKLDGITKGVLENIKQYNEYQVGEKAKIKSGYYNNKGMLTGGSLLKESNYEEINWKDGISTEELAKLKLFALSPSDKVEIKLQPTGDAIQRQQMANSLQISRENNYSQEKIAKANREAKAFEVSEEGIIGTNSVLAEIASIINKGEKGSKPFKGVKLFGAQVANPSNPNIFTIADPTMLKEFTGIDEAKPNSIQYNKETDEFILKFAVGEDQKIDGRTYVKSKIKQTYPNKDIGDINNYVTRLYDQEGSLYNISKMYDKSETKKVKQTSDNKKVTDPELLKLLNQ